MEVNKPSGLLRRYAVLDSAHDIIIVIGYAGGTVEKIPIIHHMKLCSCHIPLSTSH